MAAKTTTKPQESWQLSKAYLVAYNGTQIVGWTYMLLHTLGYFLNRGTLDNFWKEISWNLLIFQNAAALEVLHAVLGIVPTGVFLTLTQVTSRVFLVCGVLLVSDAATMSPGMVLCVLAWSVTEIIRYGYYVANAIGQPPPLLMLLRYSTFFLLYPLGVTGELLCIYDSLKDIAARQFWTVPVLSNYVTIASQYHIILSMLYHYFLICWMLLYIPMFPMLFGHMMQQRKKVLSKFMKSY
ncbi:very-long-chain (3R)-3-hydroxyacyl-CoA dehydratase hpo-8-like [Cydia splendana]|uniref:very-long-chain (3R)-3-hydroxyacyl-CoA dehydratase hpo-8-like n=1 Tax=Cydia splendana TaxID=1100963 RepID=UPI00300D6170